MVNCKNTHHLTKRPRFSPAPAICAICSVVFALPLGLSAQQSPAAADEPAVHLYVVRRALDLTATPRVRELAHSAVLLESKSGSLFLLEYLSDSKAHLSPVKPEITETKSDHLLIKMAGRDSDGKMRPYSWTRQKQGVRLDQSKTIAQLQQLMQSSMSQYSVWDKEYCHTAQERLREQLGVLDGKATFDDDPFVMVRRQLTFDAEGREGGTYHSRTPHVPSSNSGLTIGRGYDLKQRNVLGVETDLMVAGLTREQALVYAAAVGLQGDAAKVYIAENKDKLGEITPQQQKRLFEVTYAQIEADVKRICSKADVVEAYGATDWGSLNTKIKDVLIDLRFRGDYTPASRRFLQKHIAGNDLAKFKTEIEKEANWPNVPEDRFRRRAAYFD